jgi:phospholipase C
MMRLIPSNLCVVTLLGLVSLMPGFASARVTATAPIANTPIEHLIVLMQENHSFDNYFGTYPGADGIPPGTCIPVDPFNAENTDCVKPFHIGDEPVEVEDPDHSKSTHHIQYNEGRMDGFVYALNRRNQDGRMAMGYYDDRDLPYYWNLADEYVLFDRFFSSAAGGSLINHMYWVSASPVETTVPGESIEGITTIFDRLEEAGISWKFYIQNYDSELNYRTVDQFPGNRASQVVWAPLLMMDRFLDDPNLASHIVDLNQYFDDLQHGTLPAVAFMVPSGPSEHPPSNLQSGQRFVRSLIQALMRSDAWNSSAFMVTYDDWGGWYDHVPPPSVDAYGYGFRVPAFLVSPYAKKGFIDSTELDYTSILKFIEDNYDLEPLAERDARANSIANAFDFTQAAREPRFIPWDRPRAEVVPPPRRAVVYLTYGVALSGAGLLVFGAVRSRHRHLRRPIDTETTGLE